MRQIFHEQIGKAKPGSLSVAHHFQIRAAIMREAWQDKICWLKDRKLRYVYYTDGDGAGGLKSMATFKIAERIGQTDATLFGSLGEHYQRQDKLIIQSNCALEFRSRGRTGRIAIVRKFPIHDEQGAVIGVGGIILEFAAHSKPADEKPEEQEVHDDDRG